MPSRTMASDSGIELLHERLVPLGYNDASVASSKIRVFPYQEQKFCVAGRGLGHFVAGPVEACGRTSISGRRIPPLAFPRTSRATAGSAAAGAPNSMSGDWRTNPVANPSGECRETRFHPRHGVSRFTGSLHPGPRSERWRCSTIQRRFSGMRRLRRSPNGGI